MSQSQWRVVCDTVHHVTLVGGDCGLATLA